MADIADDAQKNSDQFLGANIAACRSKLPSGVGSGECVGCEEPISAARKKAVPGCERCVDCQSDYEKKLL